MIIRSLKLKNFGLYYGEHTLAMDNSLENKPITLIGGLNGRGKTTLLDAIILGLYGQRALRYLQDGRIKYSKYLENHINKSAPPYSQTAITIVLAENKYSSEEILITRYWYKNERTVVDERFYAERNGIEDKYLSENWDYFVEEILPLSISRFFFFDGEKIAQIADDESFGDIKESIRALLGFTTIDLLVSDMSRLSKGFQRMISDEDKQKTIGELVRIQSELDAVESSIKAAYADAGHYKRLADQDRKRLEDEKDRFWKAGGNLGLRREQLLEEQQAHRGKLEELMTQLKGYVEDPTYPLLLCHSLLSNTRESIRRTEKVKVERISMNVIAQLLQMIEETDYSKEQKDRTVEFLEKASSVYATEDTAKEELRVSDAASMEFEMLQKTAMSRSEILKKAIREALEIEERISYIEDHLSREVSNTEAEEHWNNMQTIQVSITENDVHHRLAEERYETLKRERERILQQQKKRLAFLREVGQDVDENQRKIRYSMIVTNVMEEFKKRIQKERVSELQDVIYHCFQSMVGKEGMIKGLIIDGDTLDIKLIDYTGGELLKSQLSAGEKQMFAVALLWGLAQSSGYDMPVIIDTPLGRLDSQHRANFVKGYLPYASNQVIVLSTDAEISEEYLEQIKDYIGKSYTLTYDSTTRTTSVVPGYFGGEMS